MYFLNYTDGVITLKNRVRRYFYENDYGLLEKMFMIFIELEYFLAYNNEYICERDDFDMNNSKRRKQRITALTLAATLLMGGCGSEKKNDHFELIENENNEIVVMDDSYIDSDYIGNYYVIEVYNKLKNENEVYIALKKTSATRGYYYCGYLDIFTNVEIVNNKENEEDVFSLVKVTNLKDYIVSFGLGQLKYSYEDMKNIYEVIKDNYVFENDDSLRRVRTIDSRI